MNLPIVESVNILHCNLRSFYINRENLMEIIRKHIIKIINLNEPFLKPNLYANIKYFDVVREDRGDGYGSIAIYIHKDIDY